jgi:PPOX class probable F420-dependent enzyme
MRIREKHLIIDTTTEFGERVARRLSQEKIAWFTTVSQDGTPQPRPVWFLWNGESFLIFSQAEGFKVRHLNANPKASLHLDGDGQGGDIVVFVGEAQVETNPIVPDDQAAYIEKYRKGFKRIGMSPDTFAARYQIAIRLTPGKLRGH